MTSLARIWKRPANASRSRGERVPHSPALLVTVGLFFFYLFVGGSSRFDVLSVPIIRPVAVLATFYGLWQMPAKPTFAAKAMLGLMAATFVVMLLYLVPLPPALWTGLSSHAVIVEVDRAAQLGAVFRPLTLSPALTENALFALFVPASILTNGLCLSDDELRRLAPAVLVGALLSCLLATAQMLGPSDGPLYFYRTTTNGAAAGFFANRNHHAVFLASILPVLLTYAVATASDERVERIRGRRGHSRQGQGRPFAALLLACLVMPMLLVIGSRGGFAAAIVALLCLPFLYVAAGGPSVFRLTRGVRIGLVCAVVLIAIIVTWAIFSPRSETLARLSNPNGDPELRFKVWPVVIDHLSSFFPWGSGPGTYEVAYKLIEPDQDLRPTYSNHAHNDWLEGLFTLGMPGVLLFLAGAGMVLRSMVTMIARRAILPARAWGWTGVIMLAAFSVGSVVDYPLRVPSLEALFVIACLWIKLGATAPAVESAPETAAD